MSEGPTTKKHKEQVRKATAAVITLSDSRTLDTDDSGILIRDLLENNSHTVLFHKVIPDNREVLLKTVLSQLGKVDLIITNGGTGISPRDITVDTLDPMFKKHIPAFGTLFASLSFDDVGSAALVSRATAGIVGKTAVFCMPGSPKAVRLGMEKLILPEIGHIVKHLEG